MDAIDFAGTSTSLVTQLTGEGGPIKAGMAVAVVLLAVTIGLKVYKRFTK